MKYKGEVIKGWAIVGNVQDLIGLDLWKCKKDAMQERRERNDAYGGRKVFSVIAVLIRITPRKENKKGGR